MSKEGQAWGHHLPDIIHGCWQLSEGHGARWTDDELEQALGWAGEGGRSLVLDMADIYTGVEERIGGWIRKRGSADPLPRIHTKFVPDRTRLPQVDRRWVEASVDGSLRRLGVERVDLVQFHWWDFTVPGWIEVAAHLAELVPAGKVGAVGVTNFDRGRLATLVDAGVPVVSNQIQLSVLDRRPLAEMTDFCQRSGVAVLCYGTLAGGLLQERWLDRPRPTDGNRSVAKYLQVVDEVGRWPAFQSVLHQLQRVAEDSGLSLAEAAMSYARFQPGVRAVIVGLSRTRAGPPPRLRRLSDEAMDQLAGVLPPTVPGQVYEAERVPDGPHARLMRYDLGGDPR